MKIHHIFDRALGLKKTIFSSLPDRLEFEFEKTGKEIYREYCAICIFLKATPVSYRAFGRRWFNTLEFRRSIEESISPSLLLKHGLVYESELQSIPHLRKVFLESQIGLIRHQRSFLVVSLQTLRLYLKNRPFLVAQMVQNTPTDRGREILFLTQCLGFNFDGSTGECHFSSISDYFWAKTQFAQSPLWENPQYRIDFVESTLDLHLDEFQKTSYLTADRLLENMRESVNELTLVSDESESENPPLGEDEFLLSDNEGAIEPLTNSSGSFMEVALPFSSGSFMEVGISIPLSVPFYLFLHRKAIYHGLISMWLVLLSLMRKKDKK